MTSEVVVMNRLAVALAADSAAAIDGRNVYRTYDSANKLFMLSKRHPVGVMIYNNASLLGLPWEVIIKTFRQHLGSSELAHLADYGHALIAYLDGNDRFFPNDLQEKYYLLLVNSIYERLERAIQTAIWQSLEEAESPEEDEIAKRTIEQELAIWRDKPDVTCFDLGIGHVLATKKSGELYDLGSKLSARLPVQLDQESMNMLRELAILVVQKDAFLDELYSGVVVAGFGGEDLYPAMQEFRIGDMYVNHLKYQSPRVHVIDDDRPSLLQPFAHSKMINSFVSGVDPSVEETFLSEVGKLLDQLHDLADQRATNEQWQAIHDQSEVVQSKRNALTSKRRQQVDGIHDAISMMPKDELAHVAASLVNLNSFQQRVSLDKRTVGGPIDVAVISKGDGFVWIDRKHYFRPELNQHFFQNYYADIDKTAPPGSEKTEEHENDSE